MAHGPVSDLYQRYKIGTNRITQWIAETATRIGKLDSIFSSTAGKARHGGGGGGTNIVRISTAQLVRLTVEIATTAIRDRVPPKDIKDIIIITQDVLAGRKEYGVWYEQKTVVKKADHEQQNETHQHFIEVLIEILDHLKRAQKYSAPVVQRAVGGRGKKAAPAVKESKKVDEGLVLQNVYKGLQDEYVETGTLEEALEGVTISTAKKAVETAPEGPEFELEQPEDEDLFALWCLLTDFQKVRGLLKSTWQEYYDRKISLMVAADLTDSALSLVQHIVEGFGKDFPRLSTFTQFADRLNISVKTQNERITCFASLLSHAFRSGERHGAARWKTRMTPSTLAGCIPTQAMRLTDAFDNFMPTLLYLSELRKESGKTPPCLDTFTGFMRHLVLIGEEMQLYSIVACQIMLDILDCLQYSQGHFSCLFNAGIMTKAIFQDAKEIEKAYQSLPTLLEDHLSSRERDVMDDLEAVLPHVLGNNDEWLLQDDTDHTADPEKFRFQMPKLGPAYIDFPVLSGFTASVLLNRAHANATFTCNRGFLMISAVHLYYACRKAGVLATRWNDMEFFVNSLTSSHWNLGFGVQDLECKSSSILACARQFGLALGVPLHKYGSEHKQKGGLLKKVPLPAASTMIKKKPRIAPMTVRNLIQHNRGRTQHELGVTREIAHKHSLSIVANMVLSDPKFEVDEGLRAKWKKCRRLPLVDLLQVHKTAMIADELKTCFEYHQFFLDCIELMNFVSGTASKADAMVIQLAPL